MLAALKVPFPTLARQREIVDNLDQVSGETQRLRDICVRRVDALNSLRTATLNAAFGGAL
jgi:hypothetical protein